MNISRNQTHFIVMTVIYNELNDFVYFKDEESRDARELIAELCEKPFEECDPFIIKCVAASMQNYGEIKSKFVPYLKNWKWERIPLLTQAILIMSYAHYYLVEQVDKKVVIDVAVSLAKKYIEEKQASFINAILDEVIK
jgi:transcription termination factor NusB